MVEGCLNVQSSFIEIFIYFHVHLHARRKLAPRKKFPLYGNGISNT